MPVECTSERDGDRKPGPSGDEWWASILFVGGSCGKVRKPPPVVKKKKGRIGGGLTLCPPAVGCT